MPGLWSKRSTVNILSVISVVLLVCAEPVFAVTCTTQAQMTASVRSGLEESALHIGQMVQKGDVDSVKAATLSKVASQFDGIAGGIQSASPLMQGAMLVVDTLYLLDASDLKQEQEAQFFCGSSVALNFQQLPPGHYAFAILHATGVAHPQQFAFVLGEENGWKLAGFYVRPLLAAGQDGVSYWSRAREFAKKRQLWNAYFYYQTAQYLLTPVDFLSSPNLEKLQGEQSGVVPPGLPGAQPMVLTGGDETWKVTNLRTDASLGALDLVIHYEAQPSSDPVASRQLAIGLMKAMLAAHPELREGFHGLWVYADAPTRPFAIELPMNQIQ
jgi:hypothetical protein